jgi:hypothetical protein
LLVTLMSMPAIAAEAVVVSPADLEVWLKVTPDHVPETVTSPSLSIAMLIDRLPK